MNKTLSIGLAGFSFTIEEHAYIKLSDYLNALRSSLDASEADEVMHDIEIRMVEIFRDTMAKREVINDTDVEKVIAQIGSPEKIEEQEEAYYSEKNTKKSYSAGTGYTDKKQLFRDPERQKIAGVCAGLAHYVGMDITAMRAIWLGIFILGIFTAAISSSLIGLLYIILWAVLPKAETAADFLKMKGKPMNFDNLKNESNKLVQFANESTQRVGEIYIENKPYINNAGSGLWNVIRYILGGIFALISFSCLIGVFVIFGFMGNDSFPPINQMDFYFDSSGMKYIIMVMIVLGSLIPAMLFGLLSMKLISPKTKLRNTGWVIGALILALIAVSTYFGISMAKKDMFFKGHKEDTEEIAIPTNSDSIYVDVKQIAIPQNFTGYEDDIYSDKISVYEKDWIHVDVTRKADIKTPYLIIKKEAKGYNIPLNASVPVEIVNNKVILPNYIKYPYDHRFRDYSIDYELVIPQNAVVIPLKKDGINFDGDTDGNGINDNEEEDNDDENGNISIEKNKISINGSTIEYNSNDKDSVIINGKKYQKEEADKIMDTMKMDIDKMKDVDIKIKDGKKEFSIKTK
ncbi:PspC domain-containing protein [Chryseobacterium aquaticum]|jgi:phage shock protein PspC (stress-responsive transcriptional regulator)|uniref:PspC domain-containing protein n=1 Tax=Chryseobacterium aquaticum TaxID=452084 RepID=A0A848N7R5_9FLAO|nr:MULTISPECIES: PspC domain-containing protein [Chryseobacterium]NMR34521.1 PspC domain-containing protein [Chryseobacterium aquaticum]NRQ46494.1 PspC domain-containing protein [Chryseobacterium sp. C-204]